MPPSSVSPAEPADDPAPPAAAAFPSLDDDTAPSCGALSALELGAPTPLLADRLRIRSVRGAADDPVPWDVMGAPDAPEDRSRVYYEQGDVGLAIVARERFQRAGRDFPSQAVEHLRRAGGRVGSVASGDPALRVFAWQPEGDIEAVADSAFLLDALVAHPDGTVQGLQMATFPGNVTSTRGCAAFARSLVRTLVPGPRALRVEAGVRALPRLGELTVPQGWVLVTQPGPDFAVHRLRLLGPFPQTPLLVGIYHGDHPRALDPNGVTERRPGQLLGQPVEWQIGRADRRAGPPVHFAQTEIARGDDRIQAWVHSADAAAVAQGVAIAESARR